MPGLPAARMPRPRSPPRLNLTGMALPALATLTVGRLSTGERKPVNGHVAANGSAGLLLAGAYVESSEAAVGHVPAGLGFEKQAVIVYWPPMLGALPSA